MDILDAWNKFKDRLSLYSISEESLNPGCKLEFLSKIEAQIGLKFPNDFKSLYLTNNGQKLNDDKIFKASSGWSKFSKLYFLELEKIPIIMDKLKNVDVFDSGLIPFAVDDMGDSMDDVYCIDSKTEEVYLLWVAAIDWTLPDDWQTSKLKRADNLIEFFENQMMMY